MKFCNICGATDSEKRLVRDHNHRTGYIRGDLCDQCNSWLGVLECHPYWIYQKLGSTRWRKWVVEYAERILKHLDSNTKVLYSGING